MVALHTNWSSSKLALNASGAVARQHLGAVDSGSGRS
jgi:hypothetical protein